MGESDQQPYEPRGPCRYCGVDHEQTLDIIEEDGKQIARLEAEVARLRAILDEVRTVDHIHAEDEYERKRAARAAEEE